MLFLAEAPVAMMQSSLPLPPPTPGYKRKSLLALLISKSHFAAATLEALIFLAGAFFTSRVTNSWGGQLKGELFPVLVRLRFGHRTQSVGRLQWLGGGG